MNPEHDWKQVLMKWRVVVEQVQYVLLLLFGLLQ
jgi:hypothetical protein